MYTLVSRPRAEGVDAGMLQKAPHPENTRIWSVSPRHPRPQAADAPHVEGDGHAGLAGLGQLVDELPVGDRVDLDEDAGLLPPSGLLDLPVHQLQQPGLEGVGGHQQLLVLPVQIGGGHVLEEGRRVGPDGGAGGHEAEVGVQSGGFLVVVAGADLSDVLDAALLPGG